ncbi:MAG: cobyric acid synthase, partial [Thermodesulfobacteriota bacterium]|nr:cobyric acid synthase [Thermodesulfobacteriota bacterium]
HGKVFGRMNAVDYHDFKPSLRKAVMESYNMLANEYEMIVMEGAGSCCEMNLKENDLVNLPMAKAVHAPCVLVADIDRGGVFAQLIGSYQLMTRDEKELITGFLINKFRGDPLLFSSGIEYIEQKTSKPVLGVVPFYKDIHIDSEDSVTVQEDKRVLKPIGPSTVNIAVIKLPAISNFTDLEILENEPDVVVNYLFRPREFSDEYDCLILPGTKNVMEDAVWLGRSEWKKAILGFMARGRVIFGICGGYQLMGQRIRDPSGVESDRMEIRGLGLLPVETTLDGTKIVRKVTGICLLNGNRVSGYEIHMGRSRASGQTGMPFLKIHLPGEKMTWTDGWAVKQGQVAGTYVHGIMDSPGFRGAFINNLRRAKDLIEKAPKKGRRARFHQYERLADHFEAHCDVDKILSSL